MRLQTRTSGFTLVELVIVIAVIAIMAALLVPTVIGQIERAKNSRATSDVSELAHALARVRTDTGVSTTGCVDVLSNLTSVGSVSGCQSTGAFSGPLAACATSKPGNPCWGGPYVALLTVDPWGANYYATLNASNYDVTVGSSGPDGISGDSDDDTYVQ